MAKPTKNELTLALDGEVSPRVLAEASAAFAELLEALLEQNAKGVRLEWVITDLHHGSGHATAQCRALDSGDAQYIPHVIAAGSQFGENVPITRGNSNLRLIHDRFRKIASDYDRVTRVRLETPDGDFVLAGPERPGEPVLDLLPAAFGSVTGRVQAMSNRGSLRFTLYDLNEDKATSCYLDESKDAEVAMLDLWGRLVEVEGYVRRDPKTDRPLTVRGITQITKRDAQRSWRDALGAAPGFLVRDSSEDIIRRIRDA